MEQTELIIPHFYTTLAVACLTHLKINEQSFNLQLIRNDVRDLTKLKLHNFGS